MPEPFYIILSKDCVCHCGLTALGHEIHVSRFILFDLLQKNLIDSKSIIVTVYRDRFFLYEKYFENVISYQEYKTSKTDGIEEMDLTEYSNSFRKDQIDVFKKMNYHYHELEKTDFFMNCVSTFRRHDITEMCENEFILIHTRTKITGRENKNLDALLNLIDTIKSIKNINIVVFSTDRLDIQKENVHFIDSLHLYASFLNNENCKLFISEWSGGGQLSQYFYNGKILYYFDNYPSHDYEKNYVYNQDQANKYNNVMNAWDFKSTTKCERFYYKTLVGMLEDLKEFI